MDDELRELIKGFLGKLEEDGSTFSLGSTQRENKDDSFFWMRALRYCPRELVDLVNSKACRGLHPSWRFYNNIINWMQQARLCLTTH